MRVPNKMNPSRATQRSVIILIAKDKDRIVKAAREKQESRLQGSSHKGISIFLYGNDAGQKGVS